MQLVKVKISSSLIGDLGDFLYHNSGELTKLYADFNPQVRTDRLPDGREVVSRLINKNNEEARFLPGRIDYTYNYTNSSITTKDVLDATKDFYKTLGKRFPSLSAARIAVVMLLFVDNENNATVDYLSKKFGLTSVFGNSSEMHLRINNPLVSFEHLNSVLDIDMGKATNKQTQETKNVLMISIDVNTLAENKQNRFFAGKCDKELKTLFELAEKKAKNLEKFINK